ncbi:MAG: 5'/3'-nucleotidase SurE [Acidimicrobiales bacterium]
MRILVSNDDGVRAPGLAAIARVLRDTGHDVVIAAPMTEASGAGAGVGPLHTMRDGVHLEKMSLHTLEGIDTFGVDALPALIVISACYGAFGPPPDLIVSGINAGRNVGRAVLHSGTVGAALTGVHFDKRAMAVSIQSGPFAAFESSGRGPIHFETAATLAVRLVPVLAEAPARTVVNLNVPNLPLGELRGIVRAPLSRSGLVRSAIIDGEKGPRMQLELGFGEPVPDDDTDEPMTSLGYATMTALASVAEDLRQDVQAMMDTLARAAGEPVTGVSDDAGEVLVSPVKRPA